VPPTTEFLNADLTAARSYLLALSAALQEAALSPDPRVVSLGLALAKHQLAEQHQ